MLHHPVIVLPLTPIELSTYNGDYYRNHKQWMLNMTVNLINEEILYQNTWSGYTTPLIHETIYRAEGHVAHRYYFGRLRDGLHPTQQATRKLHRALSLNGHI